MISQRLTAPRVFAALTAVLLSTAALVTGPVGHASAVEAGKSNPLIIRLFGHDQVELDECTLTGSSVLVRDGLVTYDNQTLNICTGERSGVTGQAPATLVRVKGNLSSAHVVASVPLRDVSSGELTGEVFLVDVTWTATDKAQRERDAHLVPAITTGTVPMDDFAFITRSRSFNPGAG